MFSSIRVRRMSSIASFHLEKSCDRLSQFSWARAVVGSVKVSVWEEAGLERDQVDVGVEMGDCGEWWDIGTAVEGGGILFWALVVMGRFPFLSCSEEIRWARRAIKCIRASWRPRIVVDGPRRGYLHSESSRLNDQM